MFTVNALHIDLKRSIGNNHINSKEKLKIINLDMWIQGLCSFDIWLGYKKLLKLIFTERRVAAI